MVLATLVGYVVGHLATDEGTSASGLLVLFLMAGLDLVGFIEIFRQTNLGLRSGAKVAGRSWSARLPAGGAAAPGRL
jgi:phospho-N-acetylmuramoyl-pentapeptide-transferase